MEAVVGFFAGLLPGAVSSKTSSLPPPEPGNNGPATSQDSPPSPSPLTNHAFQRRVVGGSYDLADTEPHTPSTLTSSIESLGEPTSKLDRPYDSRINKSASTVNMRGPRSNHPQRPPLPHRKTTPFSHNSQQMQKQPSRSSMHLQAIQQQHSNMVSPRSPRASSYVRCMDSASFLSPRPSSTPAHITRPAIFVTDNDHDDSQPPLPPSWLESVARAVLFGGSGAHIGGPSGFISHHHESLAGPSSAKPHVLRSTRSSLSQASTRRSKYHRQPMNRRSGLSDQTNSPVTPASASRNSFFGPPSLFSEIERGRSRRSEGEVSRTRVVCRSAPGSRSGSLTRSGGGNNDGSKERSRKRNNNRKKKEKGRLPSLARTQVEGDVWEQERKNETRGNYGGSDSRYLSGWDADADSEAGSGSEEEEDGELDLARILVPPKRQNSIKSLRKHLTSEAARPGHGAYSSLKYYDASAGREIGGGDGSGGHRIPRILRRRKAKDGDEDWDGESQEEWGGGWVRKGAAAGNRESEDDNFVGFGFFGEGRTNLVGTSKKNGSGGTNQLGFRGLMGNGNSSS